MKADFVFLLEKRYGKHRINKMFLHAGDKNADSYRIAVFANMSKEVIKCAE